MDDRNGDCFEHHEDVYGSIASDSEHDCLKDFLLEPGDPPRNVPLSVVGVASSGNILDNCSVSNLLARNSFVVGSDYSDRTGSLELSKIGQDACRLVDSCVSSFGVSDPLVPEVHCGVGLRPLVNSDTNGRAFYGPGNSGHPPPSSGGLVDECNRFTNSICETSACLLQNTDQIQNSIKCSDDICSRTNRSAIFNYCMDDDFVDGDRIKSIGNGNTTAQNEHKSKSGAPRGRKRKGVESVSARGRPVGSVKKKVTYQSQISPDQNGIKIRIRKASTPHVQRATRRKGRTKKRKIYESSDSDNDDLTDKKVTWKEPVDDSEVENEEPEEQSDWGYRLPIPILMKIFSFICHEEGCLPFLVRMSRVCRLWYKVSIIPSMWHNIDLTGAWFKERYKSESQLRWLCTYRLTQVQDLNIGGWKVSNIQDVLDTLCTSCQNIRGITLSGWQGLNGEQLKYIIVNLPRLSRLDLSSINICSTTKNAVSMSSLNTVCQIMGERLTHLVLANNRIAGLPQIITAVATHCPNLEVLDISNITTHSTAPLHIEKLQAGCQKLKVLRITNSHVCLSPASLKEQVASPGFPALEELSVAGVSGIDGLCPTPIIDDNSVERILKTSHKLRLLDVRGCSRISDSSLVRVPAWDLEHLFLSGCYVTRLSGSGLELIVQKWSHSLVEMDLAWSTATQPLDLAVTALAERGAESPLRILNLCGSSVSLNPVKAVLMQCPQLSSLNLSSCRALPRGMKRLYEGYEVAELRSTFQEKPDTDQALASTEDGEDDDDRPSETLVDSNVFD